MRPAAQPAGPGCRASNRAGGFTLIETLVGLVVLMMASLLLMTAAWQLPVLTERLEAQQKAHRAIEGTLERLRAGQLPVNSAVVLHTPEAQPIRLRSGIRLPIQLRVTATPSELPEVADVLVRVDYVLRGGPAAASVRTKLWKPGLTLADHQPTPRTQVDPSAGARPGGRP